jgi:hypothetical protein
MIPFVTPATARSDDVLIDATCASTDSDRSKHAFTDAAMSVSRRNVGTPPA